MFTDNSLYSISSQFVTNNALCTLSSLSVEPVVGGTTADYTTTDGLRTVTLLTDHTASQIDLNVPYLNEVELDFRFRVKVTLTSGLVGYTDNIVVRNTDCCFSTITAPTIQTPPSGLDHIPFSAPGVYTIGQFQVSPVLCNNNGLNLVINGMAASTLLTPNT